MNLEVELLMLKSSKQVSAMEVILFCPHCKTAFQIIMKMPVPTAPLALYKNDKACIMSNM